MKIKTLEENVRPDHWQEVKVKEMGNITEIMYSEKINHQIYIKKISDTEYIDLRTGEVKQCNKIANRSQNINSIRLSLGRLRDYINTNVIDVKKCRWVTLSYAENMTDTKRLYIDFDKFNKRAKYYLSKKGYSYEYIVAMEPQGRGSWHAHLLMIFDQQAPFIKNDSEDPNEITMASLWGHGFTKTKKLDKVDNVGAYLTAYLGDIDFQEYKDLTEEEKKGMTFTDIKEVECDGVKKSILKGARLHMYPPKFNLYRCSRGIKKPVITYETEKEAQKKVSAATLTFEKTIELNDQDSLYSNTINYRHYNSIRSDEQL